MGNKFSFYLYYVASYVMVIGGTINAIHLFSNQQWKSIAFFLNITIAIAGLCQIIAGEKKLKIACDRKYNRHSP